MNDKLKKSIENLTQNLLKNIGEDPEREGLLRTPHRVAKSWEYFSEGYLLNIDDINLYEVNVIVEFNHKIRDEVKFENIEDLKEQIKNDILSLN